jgi:glycosyltransferase involved in cell wall biosynthesis
VSAPDTAEPKVSVVVMTYNHRRYIEQALDSVLSQRTTFPWELLIS